MSQPEPAANAPRGPAVSSAPLSVSEYRLPGAQQTHEIVAVGGDLLVLSQQTSSTLVKVALDPATGAPRAAARFPVGSAWSGLHGLFASARWPGSVWATLQFDDAVVLLDVGGAAERPPRITRTLPLPRPVRGPHVVVEDGADLWVTGKDSHHVLRINPDNPADYTVWPCSPRPIFVARDRNTGLVYASLDQSSRILLIEPQSGGAWEIDIPAEKGSTPVGLVTGADGSVWFVLLGNASGATGTFARVTGDGEIAWYRLTSMVGAGAGLIHLSFPPAAAGAPPRVRLLGSSMANMSAVNAVFDVEFDGADYGRVAVQRSVVLPTQHSMTHRLLSLGDSVYVCELGVSTLAQVKLPPGEAERVDETSDFYSLYGLGLPADVVEYAG